MKDKKLEIFPSPVSAAQLCSQSQVSWLSSLQLFSSPLYPPLVISGE